MPKMLLSKLKELFLNRTSEPSTWVAILALTFSLFRFQSLFLATMLIAIFVSEEKIKQLAVVVDSWLKK